MNEFAALVKQHLVDRGWDRLRPSDLAKSIMIEGAELLEVFQWDNQEPEEVAADAEKMAQIRHELADVMIYCFELAVTLGLDVEEIVKEKLAKVAEKYPVEVFNPENRESAAGTEAAYKEVKARYRREGRA